MPDPRLAADLLDMLAGYRVTVVIHTAATLGIADLLVAGPRTSADLSRATETHEPSLRRLLQALVTLGLCTRTDDDAFELTATGGFLAGDAPQSLKPWALLEGRFLLHGWDGLIDSIRTGKTGGELAGVGNRFEHIAEMGNAELFNDAMVALTRFVAPAAVAAYDFDGIATVVDVGGGNGELLSTILRAHASMRGVIFDLAHCAEGARRHLDEAGLTDRAEFVAGSFFESAPPRADALLLKSILHDWNDERSLVILRNCARALAGDGKLLVLERLMPATLAATQDHTSITLSDLNMLRGPGGRERTEREFRDLLLRGGFSVSRIVPAGRFAVIEATPT